MWVLADEMRRVVKKKKFYARINLSLVNETNMKMQSGALFVHPIKSTMTTCSTTNGPIVNASRAIPVFHYVYVCTCTRMYVHTHGTISPGLCTLLVNEGVIPHVIKCYSAYINAIRKYSNEK